MGWGSLPTAALVSGVSPPLSYVSPASRVALSRRRPWPGWRLWVAHLHLEVPSVLQSTLLKGPQRKHWLGRPVGLWALSSTPTVTALKRQRRCLRTGRGCVPVQDCFGARHFYFISLSQVTKRWYFPLAFLLDHLKLKTVLSSQATQNQMRAGCGLGVTAGQPPWTPFSVRRVSFRGCLDIHYFYSH